MASKSVSRNTFPSVLSFRRSIESTPAKMDALLTDGRLVPIQVITNTVRGVIADYKSVSGRSEKNADTPNIQTIECAPMPAGSKELQVSFGLKILGNSRIPELCNDKDFETLLCEFSKVYAEKGGYQYLSSLYLGKIADASFLFRNYDDQANVTIEVLRNDEPLAVSIEAHKFRVSEGDYAKQIKGQEDWKRLCQKFADALEGKAVLRLRVVAKLPKMEGEEVWPSQEFVEKEQGGKKEGDISRVLFKLPTNAASNHAALHSQKVTNAIRTIDSWYQENATVSLPVEPTGYYSKQQRAIRKELGNHLYEHLKNLSALSEEIGRASDAASIHGKVHHTIACLVRGGVFGMSDKA